MDSFHPREARRQFWRHASEPRRRSRMAAIGGIDLAQVPLGGADDATRDEVARRSLRARCGRKTRVGEHAGALALWGCMLQRQPAYVRLGEDPLAIVGVAVRRPGVRGTAYRTRPRAGIDPDVVGAEQITAPGQLDPGAVATRRAYCAAPSPPSSLLSSSLPPLSAV